MNAYCCPARDVCFFMPQTIWLFISCVFSLICIRAACSHLWLHAHTKTMRVYPSGFCFLFLQWRKTSCPEDPPAWAGLRAFTPDDDFCSSLQERDGMRAILESYDSELTPAEHSPQLNRRMREAEEMVQKLHAHNSELEVIKQHPSLTPEGGNSRGRLRPSCLAVCSAEGRFVKCRFGNANVTETHRVVSVIPCSVCSKALLQAVSLRVCSLGLYLEHLEE